MWLKELWDRVINMKRVSCMATRAPRKYAFNAAGVWRYPRPSGFRGSPVGFGPSGCRIRSHVRSYNGPVQSFRHSNLAGQSAFRVP